MEDDSDYVRQQEELVRQLEEGPRQADGLREEVEKALAKEPEVDPKIYDPVEQMVFRGFLIAPAEINGVKFIFKSLNHHEFEQIGWLSQDDKEFSLMFLAYGVFVVGGVNVLVSREDHIPTLMETFDEFDEKLRRKIVWHISEVNRRASEAVSLTEAYVMEQYSRFRWAQIHGIDLSSSAVTGINGTATMGLNWAQMVWRALNLYEDEREVAERLWDNAKFTGGCMAGKGIQKVYAQDNQRRKKEREERIARKDRILRQVILGERVGEGQLKDYVIRAPQTVEDLVNQLEKDLNQEKDWHDTVVDNERARMAMQRKTRDDRQAELEALSEEQFGFTEKRNVVSRADLTGLSKEEVQHRIQQSLRLKEEATLRMEKMERTPGRLFDPKFQALEEKWGTYQPPNLRESDPTNARPITPPRPQGTPFRRK